MSEQRVMCTTHIDTLVCNKAALERSVELAAGGERVEKAAIASIILSRSWTTLLKSPGASELAFAS